MLTSTTTIIGDCGGGCDDGDGDGDSDDEDGDGDGDDNDNNDEDSVKFLIPTVLSFSRAIICRHFACLDFFDVHAKSSSIRPTS